MKIRYLFLAGLLPFFPGLLINQLLVREVFEILPTTLIGLLTLLIWGLIGYFGYNRDRSEKDTILYAHLPAFLVLIILFKQEIILNRYFSNTIGLIMQFYFLSINNVSAKILNLVMFIFPFLGQMWILHFFSFLLMIGIFRYGYKVRKRNI